MIDKIYHGMYVSTLYQIALEFYMDLEIHSNSGRFFIKDPEAIAEHLLPRKITDGTIGKENLAEVRQKIITYVNETNSRI